MKVKINHIIVPAGDEGLAEMYKAGYQDGLASAAERTHRSFASAHPIITSVAATVTTGVLVTVGGYCIIKYAIPEIEMRVQMHKEKKRYGN